MKGVTRAELDESDNSQEELRDFDQINTTEFFVLGSALPHRPNVRLKRRMKAHRWGFFTFLAKSKVMTALERGEIVCWEDVRWRPLISYAMHCWAAWYNILGQVMRSFAVTMFPTGDAVASVDALQALLAHHNHKTGCSFDQNLESSDIDAFCENIELAGLVDSLADGINKTRRRDFHWA